MIKMRSLIVVLLVVAVGLLSVRPAMVYAASGDMMLASVPAESPPKKPVGLIDANAVFFGCATGAALGALVTTLPPLVGWAFYAGALPAFVAMAVAAGVGCSVGLFGGVILSAFHWLFHTIGSAWSAVFG